MMSIYGKLLKSVLLPLGDLFFGSKVMTELKRVEKTVKLSEDEITAVQKSKLDNLLRYSINNVEYYKGLGIKPEDDPVKSLQKFPILEKDHIRDSGSDMVSYNSKAGLIPQSSSGSTGKQTTVYWSSKELNMHRATQLLWWRWAGYEFGDCILQTGMTSQRGFLKRLKDILLKTKYIFAFSIDEDEVLKILKDIQGCDYILAGYASSLFVFAEIAEKFELDITFKTSISWGDKLFSHYKEKIERVFKCKVFETYASTEGFMIAAQKDLDWMYIMSPNVYLEIVDDNGTPVEDGELGHVLVTNLNGYAMPLIRYRIGDLAVKLPENEYPHERELNLPILKRVVGRDTDIVKTRSGSSMIVHSFTGIFEHYKSIKQFCVIQENMDGIIVEYISGDEFDKSVLTEIENKILGYLKMDKFNIVFKEVDSIAPTPSGKPQIIISKIVNSRL